MLLCYITIGLEIESGKVLLNIPNSAVKRLQPDSLLFTEGSQRLLNLFQNTVETESLKIFLYYQDAWWVNSLNNTQGKFSSSINPPLRGKYGFLFFFNFLKFKIK